MRKSGVRGCLEDAANIEPWPLLHFVGRDQCASLSKAREDFDRDLGDVGVLPLSSLAERSCVENQVVGSVSGERFNDVVIKLFFPGNTRRGFVFWGDLSLTSACESNAAAMARVLLDESFFNQGVANFFIPLVRKSEFVPDADV
jgi:hypothetical protein